MNNTKKAFWPKLPDGTTDWESVFEDPAKGLIKRLAKISSASTLRESIILIINRFYNHKDDHVLRKQFILGINKILPPDATDTISPQQHDAVVSLLRDIKSERKNNSAPRKQAKKQAKSFDHQVIQDEKHPSGVETHQHPHASPHKKATPAKANPWKYAAIGGAVLVSGGIAIALIMPSSDTVDPNVAVKQFVEQMRKAAAGDVIEQHVYGGHIETGEQSGHAFVSASDIPKTACASVSWVLGNRGTAVINQVMPTRISPTILKKLCGKNGDLATIYWYPKKKTVQ